MDYLEKMLSEGYDLDELSKCKFSYEFEVFLKITNYNEILDNIPDNVIQTYLKSKK